MTPEALTKKLTTGAVMLQAVAVHVVVTACVGENTIAKHIEMIKTQVNSTKECLEG